MCDEVKATLLLNAGLTSVCRPGFGPLHSAGVASKEPVHQTPVPGQELHQHQVQVSIIPWKGRGGGKRVLVPGWVLMSRCCCF